MVKPWDTATIGDFLDFKNGLNKGKEFFGYGTPIVNYTDVYRKRSLTKNDVRGKVNLTRDEIHRFDARKNDVFFTRTSETPEEVGMSSVLLDDIDDCVFSGFVLRGRPKNDMFTPEYCKYCFTTEAVRNAITMGCTYTTRALTNGKQLSAIEIVVPSKPEQEAIAQSLTDIDELILSLEKLVAKKKAIKQGAMQELLTGKRRLPGFSGKWISGKWEEVLDCFSSGATPYRGNPTFYKGSIKWVSSGELNYNHIMDTLEHISTEAKEKTNLTIHPAGIFLMAITGLEASGTRGSCAILDAPATTNQSCMAIYGTYKMSTEYLFHYYVQHGDELAFQYCQGTKQQSYTAAIVKKLPIYYPEDVAEQNAIASVLTSMDNEVRALKQKLAKYRQVKQGMMQQLLTGKIRLM